MDRETGLRGKKSLHKSVAVNGEAEISVKGNEEKKLPYVKEVALEETVKNLHEQVAYLLCECNVNDRLLAEHVKAAQESDKGRERAEALVAIQKQELQDILQQKVAANERLVHLNATLRNCRQQLSSHKKLDSKYTEARKKLTNLTVENARLSKSLVKKEKIIRNVSNQMSEAKEKFNKLILRLDSTERRNDVLKYEYRLLEKQLKLRSWHADVANRQHLEAERQKLRLLMKKRAPGHPKTKVNNHRTIKQLCEVEEENKILKETACMKENEVHFLKAEVARMKCGEQNNDNLGMEAKLLESEKKIFDLKTELESVKESKRTIEDHMENLKLINYDLDNQISAAKIKIKEAFQKVSFLEMELEDKSDHREELEATFLDLQLQLASFSVKGEVTEELEQEGKPLETKPEMTAELTNNKKSSQHSCLRDQMAAEDGGDTDNLITTTMTKQVISTTDTSNRVRNVVPWALPIVHSKKYGKGARLLKTLLFRRRRVGNKKKLVAFAAYKF